MKKRWKKDWNTIGPKDLLHGNKIVYTCGNKCPICFGINLWYCDIKQYSSEIIKISNPILVCRIFDKFEFFLKLVFSSSNSSPSNPFEFANFFQPLFFEFQNAHVIRNTNICKSNSENQIKWNFLRNQSKHKNTVGKASMFGSPYKIPVVSHKYAFLLATITNISRLNVIA